MRILNFGSLNIDFVYSVDHIVRPGETLSSRQLNVFSGGKGLNQSIALARAGAAPEHAGMIGPDGAMLVETLNDNGVGTAKIRCVEERTGNAIIQVDANGQNSIVLFGGANRRNTCEYIAEVLEGYGPGDVILLQNEVNLVDGIVEAAYRKGMFIVLNPAPFDSGLASVDFGKVGLFIMNEVEGEQMTGERIPQKMISVMTSRYPEARVVLTLGGEGALFYMEGRTYLCGAFAASVVDTTAAGDTFTGYFLEAMLEGGEPDECLGLASRAAAITVARVGAAESIPFRTEVDAAK